MSCRQISDQKIEMHIENALTGLRVSEGTAAEADELWLRPVEYARGDEWYLKGTASCVGDGAPAGVKTVHVRPERENEILNGGREVPEGNNRKADGESEDPEGENMNPDAESEVPEGAGETLDGRIADPEGVNGEPDKEPAVPEREPVNAGGNLPGRKKHLRRDGGSGKRRFTSELYRMILVGAAAVLVIGVLSYYQYFIRITTTICLDVNPSVTLSLNRMGDVRRAEANNPEAETILTQVDVKGEKVSTAFEVMFRQLREQGYINETDNTVLLSVEGMNSAKALGEMSGEVAGCLDQEVGGGSVFSQSVKVSDEARELARTCSITVGKAGLVLQIISEHSELDPSILANLSMSELVGYLHAQNIDLRDYADYSGVDLDEKWQKEEEEKEEEERKERERRALEEEQRRREREEAESASGFEADDAGSGGDGGLATGSGEESFRGDFDEEDPDDDDWDDWDDYEDNDLDDDDWDDYEDNDIDDDD